uniref:Uncharacterized protein n=1 Tax=Anopheles culicifacies TaxID=139723 RepID=A0A182M5N5_9DIPT
MCSCSSDMQTYRPAARSTRPISVKYFCTTVTTAVDSSVNSASSVPLSSTTEKDSSGKDIAVASIWFQVISGRVERFASCICLMTTGEMSMSMLSFELPQPTTRISSFGLMYWCNWSHSSGYSPYHSNACFPRLRKKAFQYSVDPKSAVVLDSRVQDGLSIRRRYGSVSTVSKQIPKDSFMPGLCTDVKRRKAFLVLCIQTNTSSPVELDAVLHYI